MLSDFQERSSSAQDAHFAEWLSSNGPLRAGVDVEDAGAIIWTLTSPDVHRLLRDECGWSGQRFQGWLEDTLVRTLLPDR